MKGDGQMKLCYGIVCYSKKLDVYYPRYLTTIEGKPLSLDEIQRYAYPQAVKVVSAETRLKCRLVIAPYLVRYDPSQKDLFEEENKT